MVEIEWTCPWCGAKFGVEEVRWRAGGKIRCPECSVSVDLAEDPPRKASGSPKPPARRP